MARKSSSIRSYHVKLTIIIAHKALSGTGKLMAGELRAFNLTNDITKRPASNVKQAFFIYTPKVKMD